MKDVRIVLVGVGNVGRAFLELMTAKARVLRDQYGLRLVLAGAADSSGGVWSASGIDPVALLASKQAGHGMGQAAGGVTGLSPVALVEQTNAHIVLEASPVNLQTGQPGLDVVRTALRKGLHVVLANKAPLVLAYGELVSAARIAKLGLAYSATVCGALPVVNIGQRDLAACDIRSVRGIFNSTSNSILAAMAQGGTYEQALRQAQLDGIAEADPTLDVDGWDTANKLVIIANSILRIPATLSDVRPVTGITEITAEQVQAGLREGKTVKLVATAERAGNSYKLSVQPEWLPATDFLAYVSGWEMGIVFDTDIMGLQQFKVDERGPVPTAAAMLRDVIRLASDL